MSAAPLNLQSERLRYPGLLPIEIVVLRQWLRLHESEYERFEYNVRLGVGVDPGPEVAPEIRAGAIASSQKRVDAVAWYAEAPQIIEVKDRATVGAVGQVVMYGFLWRLEKRSGIPPALLLVCTRAEPDVDALAAASGVVLELVTPPEAELREARGF